MKSPVYIQIPLFAAPEQLHAFADREKTVEKLYRELVSAGNLARQTNTKTPQRFVVSGYMGTGKSSILLQTLGIIRGQIPTPANFPSPVDRDRWIILYVSGKQIGSAYGLTESIQRLIRNADAEELDAPDLATPILEAMGQEAKQQTPNAIELSMFSIVFQREERKLFKEVTSTLKKIDEALIEVKKGGTRTETSKQTIQKTKEASVGGELGAESKLAKITALLQKKSAWNSAEEVSTERKWELNAELLVDALNIFFEATSQAHLPTIMVLDDCDEIVSAAGPSYLNRGPVLSALVGQFARLKPTCVVVGLRQEYSDQDVSRQYRETLVQPMSINQAIPLVNEWLRVQNEQLTEEQRQELHSFVNSIFAGRDREEKSVMPLRLLEIASWFANEPTKGTETTYKHLMAWLESSKANALSSIIKLSEALSPEDFLRCATNKPIDPKPYQLSDAERSYLEMAGFIRPAIVGHPNNHDVIIDPVCAYLYWAKQKQIVPT
jgi:hypothetical protein